MNTNNIYLMGLAFLALAYLLMDTPGIGYPKEGETLKEYDRRLTVAEIRTLTGVAFLLMGVFILCADLWMRITK